MESTKKFEKKNVNKGPKNLHVSISKFKAVTKNFGGSKELEIDGVFSVLQCITYNLISVPITCKASVLGRTEGPKVVKIGFVNGFETHMEGEEFKITILGEFAEEFKKISDPTVSVLVRTDKKTGEAVQALSFEITN